MLILCITVSTLIVVSVKKSNEEYLHSSSDSKTIFGYSTFDTTDPFYINENDPKSPSLLIPIGSTIEKIYLEIDFDKLENTSPECYHYTIGDAAPYTRELTYHEVKEGVTVVMNQPVGELSTSVNWYAIGQQPGCSKFKGLPQGNLYVEVTYKPQSQ